MTNDELLLRIAQTLKEEVGPAVGVEYPKTQAFMAAVVLEKVGRELAAQRAHSAAQAADHEALLADLDVSGVPATVAGAHAAFAAARDDASLARLVESLYAERVALGEARFNALLGRIRANLRKAVDRRMEFAA